MPNSKKYLAVFDLTILIYANYHIVRSFGNIVPEKFYPRVQQQIQNILLEIQKKYPISSYLICIDSHNFRKDFFDDYKAQREPNLEIEALKPGVIQYLISEDEPIQGFDGLESDDLLYLNSLKYENTILVSNDNDCLLMLQKPTTIFYKYQSKKFISDEIDYKLETVKKVLLGDVKDNVPRILPKGLGEAYVNKIYKENNGIPSQVYKSIFKDDFQKLEEVKRNTTLVQYNLKIYHNQISNFNNIWEQI